MEKKDNVQMFINIAGERISLNVGFDAQADVREAEESVCELYNKWKKQYPRRSDRELLAMISYQFAHLFLTLRKRYGDAAAAMEQMDASLDDLLGQR